MYMKKMAAFSSIPLMLFSLFNICAVQVYAEENITVMADSVNASAGENFSANINISNVPDTGIAGIEFAVRYDPSLITVNSVSGGNIIPSISGSEEEMAVSSVDSNIDSANSCVNIMWVSYSGKYIKNDGIFASISGTVNNGASGMAELEIVPVSRNGNNKIYAAVGEAAELYVPSVVNGSVNIIENTETTSHTTEAIQPGNTNVLLGDSNCDGEIDVRDLAMISRSVVKLVVLNEQQKANSDVITDGVINVKDVGQLKKYLIKVIDSF